MKTMPKLYVILLFLIPVYSQLFSQKMSSGIDLLIEQMSTREKIAQLFFIPFTSDEEDETTIEAVDLIAHEKIGGVIMMKSSFMEGVRMINRLQSLSKIPLLVSVDGEWGPAMRFDTLTSFPRQIQLGAMSSDSLIYRMGLAIGHQLKRMGIHINFAPSIDINNNPKNPVINTRSFGEDRELVATYGTAYMKGMKDAGVIGSAKHFPGHGDTDVDSHRALPELSFTRERIDSMELYPFKKLIDSGAEMVMIGHLQVPALDTTGKPASVSKAIITDLLKESLGFDGIVITDALNMMGIADYLPSENIPLEAYKAGVDIMLMPQKVKEAITIMEKAVERGDISLLNLNERCRKVLELKEKLGLLNSYTPVSLHDLYEDVDSPANLSLIAEIAEKTVTLIRNTDKIIPLKDMYEHTGYLSLGGDRNGKEMAEMISLYTFVDTIILRGRYKPEDLRKSLNKLNDKDHIIIAVHNTDVRPQLDFGINVDELKILTDFAAKKRVTFVYFGNPLAIPYLTDYENFRSFILAYGNTYYNNQAAVHKIFGASGTCGKLSVAAGDLPLRYSLESEGGIRLAYGRPEDFGLDGKKMENVVDSIVKSYMAADSFDGAQFVLIYENKVIMSRSYGTLESGRQVGLGRISDAILTLPSFVKPSNYEMYSSAQVEDFIRSEICDRIGMNRTAVYEGVVYSNANDLAKLLSMVYGGGNYGGIEYMNSVQAKLFFDFLLSISPDYNGNMIWKNNSGNVKFIFINDGDAGNNIDAGNSLAQGLSSLVNPAR